MTVYHVETQGDYDALMIELEEKGCEWRCVEKPTQLNKFKIYGKDTYIYEEYGGIISFSDGYYFKVYRRNETLIEYKAKGENMTEEEMKHKLQEAKSFVKKLIEKIYEYLESQKPKFKAGDIVSSEILPDGCGIVRLEEDLTNELSEVYGIWYTNNDCEIQESDFVVFKEDTRHATSEEIAEYEVALTFHKHDRKPFEVKRGDVVYLKGYDKNIFLDSGNIYKKHNFIDGDVGLVKTVEEVNEWLKGE